MAAVNSVGRGAWTEAPSPKRARSVPEAPQAAARVLSQTETAITFSQPYFRGDDIDRYKIEWTGEESFGRGKVMKIRIST